MRRSLRMPSPSMAVSLLALFVALGGTGYAAVTLQANSVTSTQIKNNSITTSDVKDHSLLSQDFKSGQLPAGAAGATGATGPTGPQGKAGLNGATNVVIRKTRATIGADATSSFQTLCNPGERATGGGGWFPDFQSVKGDAITESVPTESGTAGGAAGTIPDGWSVTMTNNGQTEAVEVYAICAAP